MKSLVENISDTARWVAIFRAEETERPDAVFKDPYARKLAGEKGEQIANTIGFARQNSWTFVARTHVIDEYISQHVAEGYDMIINLAAGLDARPYRMQLPPALQWIEVDLPEILAYKKAILEKDKPVCVLESISLDLSDRKNRIELFKQLGKRSAKALIISEGLIIYLSSKAVGELATDLHQEKSFHRWVFDLASPAVLEMAIKEMGPHLKEGKAIFQFGPEEGEDFFKPFGWNPIECKSLLQTAAKLNRLSDEMMAYASMPEPPGPHRPFPWSGVCLLERNWELEIRN